MFPAGQPAATFLEPRADVIDAVPLAPWSEVHVERRGHEHDVVPLAPVPLDAFERRLPHRPRKHRRRVLDAELAHSCEILAPKSDPRGYLPPSARRTHAEAITDDNRAQKHAPRPQPRGTDGEPHEGRPRVARRDRAVEVE